MAAIENPKDIENPASITNNILLERYQHQIKEASQHFNGRSIAIWGTRELGVIIPANPVVELAH